ncbi:glycosyltransferase family 4 protein [Oscillatoria amoena NRMC-F 0135]|nr:glycosyltransferase family 4 protein [Oscillatoria amoena NRMC-F 0135]
MFDQLVILFRKERPVIVHTHTPKAGLLGMLAAWFCGVSIRLHTIAGLPMMQARGLRRWVLGLSERVTYRCAHQVYPNSIGLMKYIEGEFGRLPKLKVIGNGSSNGVDTVHFSRSEVVVAKGREIRIQHGIPQDAVVYGFVGRVVKDKGIGELIAAFKEILTQGRDAFLLIVGPFEQDLDPLSSEDLTFLQNNKRVILAGFQQDVRPWLAASDVFVFPSYREGFPNVVMQAACMELPCIVSDINGCNEIIHHEATGIVIPVKNTTALIEHMVKLATDKELRSRLGSGARKSVVTKFDQQSYWNELHAEYAMQLHAAGRT